jgi:hypothetical protein
LRFLPPQGEKHIRLSVALQSVLHQQDTALRYCAMSGAFTLFLRLLEHSSRQTRDKSRLVLRVVTNMGGYYYNSSSDLLLVCCQYGRLDFMRYMLEEHDLWEEWRNFNLRHHTPEQLEAVRAEERKLTPAQLDAVHAEERAKMNAVLLGNLQRGVVTAAQYCHLVRGGTLVATRFPLPPRKMCIGCSSSPDI